MSLSRSKARGFSLIEAMAALVVFSVGILGVMQMNVLASQQNNLARSHTIASKIARDITDSFEPMPFNHPIFTRACTMTADDPDFDNFTNPDGLYTLQEAIALAGVQPLLGAADTITTSEGQGNFYQVAWRVQAVPSTTRPTINEAYRISIMVRYPTPGGYRQVNTRVVKFNPAAVADIGGGS
jgi:prepilin-type N-terminal cleavage/methylation domain-containing protein